MRSKLNKKKQCVMKMLSAFFKHYETSIDRPYTLNTRFVPHGATLKVRKTAPLFKLDDKYYLISLLTPLKSGKKLN